MARNEELLEKLGNVDLFNKLKRLTSRYAERRTLIINAINNELRPDGYLISNVTNEITEAEQTEFNEILDSLITVMDSTSGIEEINENIS